MCIRDRSISAFFPSIFVKHVRAIEYPEFPYTLEDLWQAFTDELSSGVGMGEKRELLNISKSNEGISMVTFTYHGYIAVAEPYGDEVLKVTCYDGELFNDYKEVYALFIGLSPLFVPYVSPPECYSRESYTLDDAVQAFINDQESFLYKKEKTQEETYEGCSCNYQVNLRTYSDISIIEWFYTEHQEHVEGPYGTLYRAHDLQMYSLFIVLNITSLPDSNCYSGIYLRGNTRWEELSSESDIKEQGKYDPDALREDLWDWVGLIVRMLHKKVEGFAEKGKHLQVLSVESPSSVMRGELVNINVTLSYNFSRSTGCYVGIQNLVTEEEIAYKTLSLSGSGNLIIPFQFLVNESATLHLSAYALYLKDGSYTHDDEGWFRNFDINVSKPLIASFIMEPENPAVNDTITFISNSTGNIVEYQWFLDGEYLASVGNSSIWFYQNASAGAHTVELRVTDADGNTDTASLTFYVGEAPPSNLVLTATTDKSIYITRENVMIIGKVTYGIEDMSNTWIDLKIHLPDGTTKTWPGGHPNSDGSFTVSYEIPTVPFTTIPPQPEDWNICLLYTSPSPRDLSTSRMPSSA